MTHLEEQPDHVAHLLVERPLDVHIRARVAVALVVDRDGAHSSYGREQREWRPSHLADARVALVGKTREVVLAHKVVGRRLRAFDVRVRVGVGVGVGVRVSARARASS